MNQAFDDWLIPYVQACIKTDMAAESVVALTRQFKEVMKKNKKRGVNKYIESLKTFKDQVKKNGINFEYQESTVYSSYNEHEKQSKEEKKNNEKEEIFYTSCIVDKDNKTIVEQVYDGTGVSYAIYNDGTGKVEYNSEYIYNGEIYRPIWGKEVQKKVVMLPSEALDYVDDKTLDQEIIDFVNQWLDIKQDTLRFAVWNIKRSWVYERFHTLNYLHALGDTGQGKSRFLDTLGSIHYKPLATSGATTAAPIFRMIDKWGGTMVFDEADLRQSDESDSVVKILNQGYEKNRQVLRCDPNDPRKIDCFNPFCPKIIATRKTFIDKAVSSRCITTVMSGTSRRDIPRNLTDAFYLKALEIRNKLLMWRFKNYYKISDERNYDVDFGFVEPRMEQIIYSFIPLFGHDKQQMEEFKGFIAEKQAELIEERQSSFDGQIVQAIYDLISEGHENINAKDIIDRGDLTNSHGKPIKPRAISSQLKALGFGRVDIRFVDGKTKRCIPLEETHITETFKRYGLWDGTKLLGNDNNFCPNGNSAVFAETQAVSSPFDQNKGFLDYYGITKFTVFTGKDKNNLFINDTGNTQKGGGFRKDRKLRNTVILPDSPPNSDKHEHMGPFLGQFRASKAAEKIRAYLENHRKKQATPIEQILEYWRGEGYPEEEFESVMATMLELGDIYQPTPDSYQAL